MLTHPFTLFTFSPHPFTGRWLAVLLEPTQEELNRVIQKIADANKKYLKYVNIFSMLYKVPS
jgi:hypothetical protein